MRIYATDPKKKQLDFPACLANTRPQRVFIGPAFCASLSHRQLTDSWQNLSPSAPTHGRSRSPRAPASRVIGALKGFSTERGELENMWSYRMWTRCERGCSSSTHTRVFTWKWAGRVQVSTWVSGTNIDAFFSVLDKKFIFFALYE